MARVSDLLAAGRTYSFEFFPPKTDGAQLSLGRTIAELEPLAPSFVSVTYGAGGSSRAAPARSSPGSAGRRRSRRWPTSRARATRRAEIAEILDDYRAAGIENILALGGDLPGRPRPTHRPSDYHYASDLIEDIAGDDFSIGVAAHPEVHPRSPDRATDRRLLAAKLAARRLRHHPVLLRGRALRPPRRRARRPRRRQAGACRASCRSPTPGRCARMAELSGAAVPGWLVDRLDGVDDPDEVRRIGVDVASALCAELLERGAPGLHLYTLNRSTASREIYANLGLGACRAAAE